MRLSAFDVADVLQLARERFRRNQTRPGEYKDSITGHAVGYAGEMAAEQWFVRLGLPVESHWRFASRERECDLTVAGVRIEMKTWSRVFWEQDGRCVTVKQLPSVEKKADVIVWATVETRLRELRDWQAAEFVDVGMRGCSKPADLRATAPVLTGRPWGQVWNHQVNEVRQFSGLVEALKRRV